VLGEISNRRSILDRSAAVAGLLLLVGVAASIILLVLQPAPAPKFDASEFRAARAKSDTSVMQTQARLAVEQHELLGISATQLQADLGKPTRSYRHSPRMVWRVGGWNSSGSLGTVLDVRLDGRTHRVVGASLEPPPD
jgi:hypothetical protein